VAQAASLAEHLRQVGVGPGEPVAVAMPRGVDLVPALIGVHLAGACYVPLDIEHPIDRLNYVMGDASVRVLVTPDATVVPGLRAAIRVHLNDVPLIEVPLDHVPLNDVPLKALTVSWDPTRVSPPDLDCVAYVIYTSGSSGRPKGVQVTHRALANFVTSMGQLLGLPADVLLPAVTTVSFDIAALELFLPITTGGRVVVARTEQATDPRRLADLLERTSARAMQATPVTWRLLLEAGWAPPPGFTVLCGGERLSAALAERLLGEDVVLWDLYGPTETTVWSSATRYERGRAASFSAVNETSLHLLGERLQPVPDGESGELYIGGAGLAVGYLGRPGLTAERFVAHPSGGDGRRLYRTGDIARRATDGRIEILGRTDEQVKIRGFRIEVGEIEHVLAAHPGVAEAAVRAVPDEPAAARLVGYIRPADPASAPGASLLRAHLARSLPSYMVPAQIVALAAFPRTLNGKLDRAALPIPAREAGEADGQQAFSAQERVGAILARVLERPEIGPLEDFFALGGDSLRAVQAVLQLNAELERDVPINALFEARTVYGLARLLDGEGESDPVLIPVPPQEPPRMSSAQWRLWVHQVTAPHSALDNEPIAIRLPDPVDLPVLQAALTGLFARHEILRTRYETGDSGQPIPVVQATGPVPAMVEEGDPQSVLMAELIRPFDLASEPPVRVRLVRDTTTPPGCVLLMVVHRIAADRDSQELIASQVRAAYRGRVVSAPALRYADYASWQRQMASSASTRRHLDYWRATLNGLRPAQLPLDRPRPAVRDGRGRSVGFSIPPDVAGGLTQVAADHEATRLMVLLAGFYALLARHADGTDLAIGVPLRGREHADLEDVVGMFEETAVIRVRAGDQPDFERLLARVREAVLGAFGHAAAPFEDVIAAVGVDPEPGRSPLFDVAFELRGIAAEPRGCALPEVTSIRYDLYCRLEDRPDGGLDGRLDYATQVFDEATVRSFADDYARLLAELA
jgi:amino acid adenylation domain-containing protein